MFRPGTGILVFTRNQQPLTGRLEDGTMIYRDSVKLDCSIKNTQTACISSFSGKTGRGLTGIAKKFWNLIDPLENALEEKNLSFLP